MPPPQFCVAGALVLGRQNQCRNEPTPSPYEEQQRAEHTRIVLALITHSMSE